MTKPTSHKFILVLSCLLFVFIISCKSDKTKKVDFDINKQETLYENFVEINNSGASYKIPSPIEMFLFLENTNSTYLLSEIHKVENSDRYISKKDMAINFGVYSADLAYCAVYSDFQQTINYFNTVKKIADKMGLHEGFGQAIALRIDNNLSSVDSLMEISADSYHLANQFLEEQGQGDVLGLILVGGWIEGLYLAIKSVKELDTQNPVVERIADQQILLENLLGYLRNNENTNYISEVIADLERIQALFDMLYFNDENTLITKTQFVDISNEVIALRNSYIN